MTESHDPWGAAREATRADVRAALAPRTRTCPQCGHVQSAGGASCERCGGDFVVRRRRGVPRIAVMVAVAALALAAAVTAAVVPGLRDDAAGERRAAAQRQQRLEAQERARLREDARPRRLRGPARRAGESALAHRERLVAAGQAAVLGDARGRARAGTVDGPIRGATCYPYPRTQPRRDLEADPSVPAGRYQCMAIERRIALTKLNGRARTGIIGVPYWLVIDYGSARMAFCKVTPKAGEGGRSLASVPVPEPCRDPLRRS